MQGHLGHGYVPVAVEVAAARPGHVGIEHQHAGAFEHRFQAAHVGVAVAAGALPCSMSTPILGWAWAMAPGDKGAGQQEGGGEDA